MPPTKALLHAPKQNSRGGCTQTTEEMGKLPTEGNLHREGGEREICTQEGEGELPTTGDPAQKGGRQTCTEGGTRTDKSERDLPTEGDPAQKGGRYTCTQRGTCTDKRERRNYPQRGILHQEGSR